MTERSDEIWIEGPVGRLEASLRVAVAARAAVVFAHPHPPQGGTMDNPVIFHAAGALHRSGMTTLRFNFRGVGGSDGEYDDGNGEVEDLAAAVARIREEAPGLPLILVGYSFGAWMATNLAMRDDEVEALVAIGLPTVFHGFEELASFGRPVAVVQGSEDELGPLEDVKKVLERCDPPGKLYVVEHSSHIFPGRAAEAAALVVEAVEEILD
jgi:alpha/beta superfamily hydrolase